MPLSFTADLQAELLTPDGRLPLERRVTLPGECGEVFELTLPDGTLNRALVLPRAGNVSALLVTSDKAVQVRIGPVTQNAPLTLQPWGLYALLDTDLAPASVCALSYTPGDGSVATCAVLVLAQEQDLVGCARFVAHPTLANGLLHCWDMDETGGARLDHVGGSTLAENVAGATVSTPGQVGRAAVFGGSNYLLYTSGASPSFIPPFTVAFWLWIDSYPTGLSYTCVCRGNNLFGGYFFYFVVLDSVIGTSGLLEMSIGAGSRGLVRATTPLTLNAWHLVIGWSSSVTPFDAGTTNLQIDNGAVRTTGNGAMSLGINPGVTVGSTFNAFSSLRGRMDLLQYWNRALTADERTAIWNGGLG